MVMNFEQNGIDLAIAYDVKGTDSEENATEQTLMERQTTTESKNLSFLPIEADKRNLSHDDYEDLSGRTKKLRKIQSLNDLESYNVPNMIENLLNPLQNTLPSNETIPEWPFSNLDGQNENIHSTGKYDLTNVSQISSTPDLLEEITVGEYLWSRLVQVGCHSIFGLPGDFNAKLLDKLNLVKGIKWSTNTSQLNASYAADGYSRIKGIGAICTTFGVGELSSINGIAGSFAEHVGVLHIVGSPAVSIQMEKMLIHHTLGNGDFKVFQRMFAELSTFNTMLQDPDTVAMEIDKCIITCIISQKPCYLSIPVNLVDVKIPKTALSTPLVLNLPPTALNLQKESSVVDTIIENINNSVKPCIIIDGCCYRHNIMKEANELIKLTNIPIFVTPMGKGAVDEQMDKFGGIYVGTMSSPEVKEYVDSADLVICIGSLLNDFATSTFHFSYKSKNVIEFNIDFIKLKSCKFPEIKMKPALAKLIARINHLNKKGLFKFGSNNDLLKNNDLMKFLPKPIAAKTYLDKDASLRQSWIWEEISTWLKPGDIIMAETGTSAFGIMQTRFPERCLGISQVLWSASGYTLGSALGVMTAARDSKVFNESTHYKRCIVFVGDGSFQFTVQEISTMLKKNLNPYIFVMNNNGFTIDRILHHSTANKPTYHDIQPWKFDKILHMFGGRVKGTYNEEEGTEKINCENFKVETVGEFQEMLHSNDFSNPDRLRLIEVVLPTMDAPSNLLSYVKNRSKS